MTRAYTRSKHQLSMIAVATTGLLFAVAACLPIPHTERLSPKLLGTFRHTNGAPIAGVQLAVSAEYDDTLCSLASVRTTTDSSGGFELPETHERVPFMMAYVDEMHSYRICASFDGDSGIVYFWHGLNQSPPRAATIECTKLPWPSHDAFCI